MMYPGSTSIAVAVQEQSQVGEARRVAANLSSEMAFSETVAGKVGIVVTELASNLMKHTQGGEIIFRRLGAGERSGLEVLSVDKGEGFDVSKCLRDGYSSRGTSGTGLGSVQRIASFFEIFSLSGRGTVSLAQVWDKPGAPPNAWQMGVICVPLKGETACGDAWALSRSGYQYRVLLVDGLGHGEHAASAAETAVRLFSQHNEQTSADMVHALHLGMRSTRGAAVALAEIDVDRRLLRFVGVGNIAGTILEGDHRRNLVSQNGTVGLEISRVTEFQHPWSADSILILHSDGLTSRWKVDDYPGLRMRHPSIIAGVLYRDFRRERDDTMVLVAKEGGRP